VDGDANVNRKKAISLGLPRFLMSIRFLGQNDKVAVASYPPSSEHEDWKLVAEGQRVEWNK
jgi:hypothetical protein